MGYFFLDVSKCLNYQVDDDVDVDGDVDVGGEGDLDGDDVEKGEVSKWSCIVNDVVVVEVVDGVVVEKVVVSKRTCIVNGVVDVVVGVGKVVVGDVDDVYCYKS